MIAAEITAGLLACNVATYADVNVMIDASAIGRPRLFEMAWL